jgi:hypothetical protein
VLFVYGSAFMLTELKAAEATTRQFPSGDNKSGIIPSTLFKLDYSEQLFLNQSFAKFMELRSKDSTSNP